MQDNYSNSSSFWQYARVGAALLALGMSVAVGAQGQMLNLPAAGVHSRDGTCTDLGSAEAAIATPDFDGSTSAPQAIGFGFTFGDTSFAQFVLTTNGYVKLGSTAPPTPYFSITLLTVASWPLKGAGTFLLVPFNTDLEAAVSGSTEYRLVTTDSPGSRVCII